jgi:hypothetical protein
VLATTNKGICVRGPVKTMSIKVNSYTLPVAVHIYMMHDLQFLGTWIMQAAKYLNSLSSTKEENII